MGVKMKGIALAISLLSLWSFDVAFASRGSGKDDADDAIEDQIEDNVEEDVEDQIESDIEDDVESDIEDQVEADIEDSIEDDLENSVESAIEASVEDGIEAIIEDDVESEISDSVEDTIADRIDDKTETHSGREFDLEDRVEERAASRVGDRAEERHLKDLRDFEKDLAKSEYDAARKTADAERKAARAAAEAAMDAALALPGADEAAIKAQYELEKDAADDARDASREAAEASFDASLNEIEQQEEALDGFNGEIDNSGPGSENSGRDDDDHDDHDDEDDDSDDDSHHGAAGALASAGAEPALVIGHDKNGDRIGIGEWLMIAPRSALAILEAQGYVTRAIEPLDNLGVVLARIEAPASLDIADAERVIRAAAPEAALDYNHLYTPGWEGNAGRHDIPASPRERFEMPPAHHGTHRIGVIDTAIESTHAALMNAKITVRDFVSANHERPKAHGTAVVSILAGQSVDFLGLAPDAEISAASVFFLAPDVGETATTVSIVRALDWMIERHVNVVNMSLTGPENDILHAALKKAHERGVVVIAAVGNAGPSARPLYPAAYENVVGVTAIDAGHKVYRLANRGAQVDFAAPGVEIWHAAAGGGYAFSSGTSMAAPFVSALLALSCDESGNFSPDLMREIEEGAEDLGVQGVDPVFGYGLIKPPR